MPTAVTTAIVIAMVLASSIVVLNIATPVIDESRSVQSIVQAINVLTTVDATINQLLLEAPGATRSLDIFLARGTFVVEDESDEIKITTEERGFLDPGDVELGNIAVESGTFMKAYEGDADGDGDLDYILENSAVLFSVLKLGSASQNVTVNTSTLIPVIKNKRDNINITPTAGVQIDDSPLTANGNGNTQLTKAGTNIEEGEIRLIMNATNNVTYNVFFRLRPNDDYVIIDIGNVTVPPGAL